jgi:hypothetical protein
MSTKIDDLPGPIPQEVQQEIQQLQQNTATEIQELPSNIKVNVKKRVHFADEKLTLSSFLNEENLMFFGFLFIATLPSVTSYVHKVPIIGAYASGDLMTGALKAALLLILFLLAKIYLLPKIKF